MILLSPFGDYNYFFWLRVMREGQNKYCCTNDRLLVS